MKNKLFRIILFSELRVNLKKFKVFINCKIESIYVFALIEKYGSGLIGTILLLKENHLV